MAANPQAALTKASVATPVEEPSPKLQKLHHGAVVPIFRVKKHSQNAVLPSRTSPLFAGYDLSSAVELKVPARGKALVPTDLSIAIPEGTYARIVSRSELARKHFIGVGAGVVDADYRGPVGVVVFNHSDEDFVVKVGDRVAHIILHMIKTPDVTAAAACPEHEPSPLFLVTKLSENAVLPSRASPLSAGYDLCSAAVAKVPARGKALVPTDLSIAIPQGTYARIASRSGLAWKHSIDVGEDVINADYRGPVGAILFNHSDKDFEVKVGDRIAQLILERVMTPDVTAAAAAASSSLQQEPSPLFIVKILSENAVLPSRASPLSAGYDLSSAVEAKVPAGGRAVLPTDLSITVPEPEGTYARIACRSELARNYSIRVGAGVIDADSSGPVEVILFNHSDEDFEVKVGDPVAQMVLQRMMTPDAIEVEDLDDTVRGAGGFGSTGV